MKQPAGAPPSLVLLDYRQVPGAVKPVAEPDYPEPDRLTILLYRDGRMLDSQQTSHPLIRQAEHPDESGAFVSRRVQLDSAEFFIRFSAAASPDEIRVLVYRLNEPVQRLLPIYLPSL